MTSLPDLILLQPGGYYKLIAPESEHPIAVKKESKKITIYTEDKGWHQVDHDQSANLWNQVPHHDPDDSDNYDHEVDPVCSGVNGERG